MPRCPTCFSPLTRTEESGIKISTCPNCFGHWMQKTALMRSARQLASESATRTPEQIAAAQQEIGELAATVVESDSKKTLRCTACSVDMVKQKLHPMIPVNMDHCTKCDCVWLDVGKLSLIKKLWAELQNTTDPEVIARRDKLAIALAGWEGRSRAVDDARQEAAQLASVLRRL